MKVSFRLLNTACHYVMIEPIEFHSFYSVIGTIILLPTERAWVMGNAQRFRPNCLYFYFHDFIELHSAFLEAVSEISISIFHKMIYNSSAHHCQQYFFALIMFLREIWEFCIKSESIFVSAQITPIIAGQNLWSYFLVLLIFCGFPL